MKQRGLLLVISGPSGCGKGTILKELLAVQEQIYLSVSAATRRPRDGEVDGVHYYFMSKEQFQAEIHSDGMLEYTCYCDNYYGTPKKPILEHLEQGDDVILEIEVDGALQIKKQYQDAILIFIMPPTLEELEQRLIGRNTEDNQTIQKRLLRAKEELNLVGHYQYIVINQTIEDAVKDIQSIIRAEKCHYNPFLNCETQPKSK